MSCVSRSACGGPTRQRSGSWRSQSPKSDRVWWSHPGARTRIRARPLSEADRRGDGWSKSRAPKLGEIRRLFGPRRPPGVPLGPTPAWRSQPGSDPVANNPTRVCCSTTIWLRSSAGDPTWAASRSVCTCTAGTRRAGSACSIRVGSWVLGGRTISWPGRVVFRAWILWSFSYFSKTENWVSGLS